MLPENYPGKTIKDFILFIPAGDGRAFPYAGIR